MAVKQIAIFYCVSSSSVRAESGVGVSASDRKVFQILCSRGWPAAPQEPASNFSTDLDTLSSGAKNRRALWNVFCKGARTSTSRCQPGRGNL